MIAGGTKLKRWNFSLASGSHEERESKLVQLTGTGTIKPLMPIPSIKPKKIIEFGGNKT